MAIDADGIITYRDGYNGGNEGTWRKVLADLAAGP